MDIINLLKNNTPIELHKLSPLDFKKFIRPKKELINKELYKLLSKTYHNFINVFLQKSVNIFPLY